MTILTRILTRAFLLLSVLFCTTQAQAQSADAAKTRAEIQKTLGFIPMFVQQVPDVALPGAWQELAALQISPSTALSCKVKELIGLAVAAQIPCKYCIYGHTEFAKLNGATSGEVAEAVAMSALARHWSTFFNGVQLDETRFRADIAQLVTNAKRAATSKAPAPKPIVVVDAKTAFEDIRQSLGFVPDFIKRFPPEALPGAWNELKTVELNPNTKLSGKFKSLIGLAVSSQIPCRYCVIADTEFAKLEGATEREITEAIAMASLVRHWSTLLHGLQVDETQYRRDIDRLVNGVKQSAAAKPAKKAGS